MHHPEPMPTFLTPPNTLESSSRNNSPALSCTSSREKGTPPLSEEELNNKLALEALPALTNLCSQKYGTQVKDSGVKGCSGKPHNEPMTPRITRKKSQTLFKTSRPSSPCINQTVLRPVREQEDEVTTSYHDGKVLKRTRSRLCCGSYEDYKRKEYLEYVNGKDQGVDTFGYETTSA